ncbi:unnamed protein product, partial [Ectocarpus sp. 12 AP-2014]
GAGPIDSSSHSRANSVRLPHLRNLVVLARNQGFCRYGQRSDCLRMAASTNDQVGMSFLGGVAAVEDGAAEEREEPSLKTNKKTIADAAPVAAKEGCLDADDGGDSGSDQWGSDSDYYIYSDSDSECECGGEWPKHPAEVDADDFIDSVDGISARVQLSPALTNVWVYVGPRRLSEGRAPGTCVKTVGLDPSKGVVVMLSTPHDYISSGKIPQVKWARQV